MSEDNILKFPENQEVEVRLKSTEPFWTGMDNYQKERFGYEIDDITGKEKFYCSKTLHELIQVSKVQKLVAFKLMLKNENNKSIWLINIDGKQWKNKYQFVDESIENNNRKDESKGGNIDTPDWGTINAKYIKDEEKPNESDNDNTPVETIRPGLFEEIQKIKREFHTRIDVLEKKVQAKESNTIKEADIPF